MVTADDTGKLFLKVERGTKPRLKLFDDSRKALVSVIWLYFFPLPFFFFFFFINTLNAFLKLNCQL